MLGDFSEWKCVCFASMSPQPAPNTVILPSSVSDFVHIRDNELPWSRNRFYSLLRFTLFSTLFVIFLMGKLIYVVTGFKIYSQWEDWS